MATDQTGELFEYLDTEAKCSLWLYPYINFIETEKRLLIPFMSRGSPVEGKWLKDIVKYTPRPRFVLDICDQFQAKFDLTKSTFLAIHWNFEKDFKDACTKKSDQFYCDLKVNSTEAFQGKIFVIKFLCQIFCVLFFVSNFLCQIFCV